MSHLSKVFSDVPVEILDRSGFDMSHENLFTATIGTLVPCYVEEVYPSDVISIGAWWTTKLPPFATNCYGHIDTKVETFFVPSRLLWGGFQNFICNTMTGDSDMGVAGGGPVSAYTGVPAATRLPNYTVSAGVDFTGTLADYLGYRLPNSRATTTVISNSLPFLAYHKIYDSYYRNALITKPFFNEATTNTATMANLPYWSQTMNLTDSNTGANGDKLNQLKQRCWAKDAFTTSTPKPQFAEGASVNFEVGEEGGSFSIASLRAANALQKFLERNNLGTTRYYDQILTHFGVRPCDGCMSKPIFLGQLVSPVYVNSVSNQSGIDYNSGEPGENNQNPWAGYLGAQAGQSVNIGEGRICDNFEVKEHGYIMALFSIVPHANYSTGIRRYLSRSSSADFVWPEFASIGDQPVYKAELYAGSGFATNLFGYNRRYYEAMYHDDEVHGEFMDGNQLQAYVISRAFDNSVALNTEFMEIPTSALDDVLIMNSEGDVPTGYNYAMVDMYLDVKMLRRLPESPLPHL